MNELEKLRARLSAIVTELEVFDAIENFSDEQIGSINTLNEEFEGIRNRVEALEKIEAIRNHASASAGRQAAPAPKAPVPHVQVINRFDKTMGFKNLGDFAMAVADKSRGKVDERFNNSVAYEMVSEDGGVLIPGDFLTEIQTKVQGETSLLAKTSGFTTSGNHLSLPIDEKEPWNGGIKVYWTGEGKAITQSKQELGQASFKLHKVAGLVTATDELLEDATALESYIRRKAPEAMVHELNDVIMNGDGNAKPAGLIGSGFTIEVAKEVAQDADTVNYKNLVKMESRLLPMAKGVWYAHPQCKEQLRLLKDDNGNYIYVAGSAFQNAAALPFDTLLGKPIYYMMGSQPALGDSGDIVLADLDYYYTLMKTSGMKQDVSTHLYFDRDLTAFKFTQRIDGNCPFKSPVMTKYGNYEMSAFVKLEAR